ncbi:MAG: hypothetical protein DRN53_00670 [Thermoprotei archaeon]|nr:MAG: hypothetical protein DRN53_00670 [Thermoprotei archaeon]
MQILTKSGDEIYLVYHPDEKIEVGETLEIIDTKEDRGLIVQVIELNLVDLPGILEDVVRQEAVSKNFRVLEVASSDLKKLMIDLKNMKIAKTKIRHEIKRGKIVPWSGWTPSRSSEIKSIKIRELVKSLDIEGKRNIVAGSNVFDGSDFIVNAYDLQGINVIVGKKGTGKSHLAKTLLLGLIDHGARVLVFDINDEYSNLRYKVDGSKSEYYEKIITLEPDPSKDSEYTPLKFTLPYIGLEVFYSVMVDVLKLPEASAATLREIWNRLEESGSLRLSKLFHEIENESSRVREAIYRRLKALEETRIVTEDEEKETRIEEYLKNLESGGALIVNLKAKSRIAQSIVVQTIVSKLRQILESKDSKPLFLFAEEAHLYLERTMWLDLVTRMRHLGAYQFYMTNTPTSIDDLIIRQTDNIFIFNLTNRKDLDHIMPATKIDEETIKSIVPALPPRTYLAIGLTTKEYPFIAYTRELEYQTAGKTRLLWKER